MERTWTGAARSGDRHQWSGSMKITLATRGGIAAAINRQRAPRTLSVESLPASEAAALAQLVDAAKQSVPEATGSRAMPDGMSYTITVDDEHGQTVLRQSDADLTPQFSELLGTLERHLD